MAPRINRILISIVLVIRLYDGVYGCGSKQPAAGGDDKPASNPSAVKNMLGDGVQTNPYDNSGFDGKNGQVSDPSDLKCDFSGPCCWKNAKPPVDTMEWVQASGTPDSQKFQKNFGTSNMPSGNYLLTSSDTAASADDRAIFMSCTIPCAGDSIQVSLKHWTSNGGPKIRICEVTQDDPTNMKGCQDLPAGSGGPDTVTLPGGQNIIIGIGAYNLVNGKGNVAIIQDLNVQYPPCTTTGAPTQAPTSVATSPAGPNIGECQKVACNFESGMCGYQQGSAGSGSFQNVGPGMYKNPATGVAKSPDNSKYAAVYLKPNEKASMEVNSDVFADSDKKIIFEEYKATEGITTRACCDTIDGCPYETGSKVAKSDFRQWYQGGISCKQGTKKIIFVAENKGPNEGGVGIDNVQVFDAAGKTQIC